MLAQVRQWLTYGGYCLVCLLLTMPLAAAEPASPNGGSGYLSGYTESAPQAVEVSWWSTLAYLVSLLAVFAFVAALAYLASRFIAHRVGAPNGVEGGRLLSHLPLGANRSVCMVEMLDHVFILGVTEHSVNLLREITDPQELEQLQRRTLLEEGDGGTSYAEGVNAQMDSLQQFVKRIPSLFRNENRG